MIAAALILPRVIVVAALVVGLAAHFSRPATQGAPSRLRVNTSRPRVNTIQVGGVMCPVTRWRPPDAAASLPPVASGRGGQLQVTVPPTVLVAAESGVLRVTTNTGRQPAKTDAFYMISRGQASRATKRLVETVLRTCG